MAVFRKINVSFWDDEKVVDDFTPEDRYFMLYLMTNTHTNQIGCYQITLRQMEFETGYNKETILKLISRFENVLKVIKFSESTKEILILNWHKYNWTKSPKVVACIKQELMQIKNIEFKNDLIEKLKNYTEDCSDLFRMANRSEISKKLAEEIMERDNYTCQICGSIEDLTIDHILPRTLGGKNIKENLRVLCRSCNSKRPLDGEKLFIELKQQGYNIEELLKINSDTVSKKNDTISKNIDTESQEEEEKEKEEEQEELKEEEQEEDSAPAPENLSLENWYGFYKNVHLTSNQYGRLLSEIANQSALDEIIEDLSSNIAQKKEKSPPYDEKFPDMHFATLKAYWKYRKLNGFKKPIPKEDKAKALKEELDKLTEHFRQKELNSG